MSTPPVLQALMCVHAADTPPAERARAHQFLEEFKNKVSDAVPAAIQLLGAAGASSGASAEAVRHFGLHILENSVKKHWDGLPPKDRDALKEQSLKLLSSVDSIAPSSFIKQKVARVVVEAAKREWPQRWEGLMGALVAVAGTGLGGTEVVLYVFGELADEIKEFNPQLSEKRRKELQKALVACLSDVYPFCFQALGSQFQALSQAASDAQAPQRKAVVKAALAAFTAFLHFLPDSYTFDKGLLKALATVAQSPEYCSLALDALSVLAERRHGTFDKSYQEAGGLSQLWDALVTLASGIVSAPAFAQQQQLLAKLIGILETMTKHHAPALKPPAADPIRSKLIVSLGTLLTHPSAKISLMVLDLWDLLFKAGDDAIIKPQYRKDLLPHLLSVCTLRLARNKPAPSEESEFESEEEYNKHFGQMRSTVLSLVKSMMTQDSALVMGVTVERYRQVLSTPPNNALNAAGWATTESDRYRELEAAGVQLEVVLRNIDTALLSSKAPGGEAGRTASAVGQVLTLLLQYQTQDPLMLTLKLQQLSQFTPLYHQQKEPLLAALQQLFEGLSFRPPNEQGKDWLLLSEDTRACRRRAGYSIIALAKAIPSALTPLFKDLVANSLQLIKSGAVSDSERIFLFEALIHVSTARKDASREEQHTFVMDMLKDPAAKWTSEGLSSLLADTQRFLQLVGMNEAEQRDPSQPPPNAEARAMRIQIMHILHTFAAIFRSILGKSVENHPASAALGPLLPNFLRFLNSVLSLWSPKCRSVLPASLKPVLLYTRPQLDLLGSAAPKLALDIHNWISNCLEHSLMLLLAIARSGPAFYSGCQPQVLIDAIFSHMPYLPTRLNATILDKVLTPYCKHCPVTGYATFLKPILQGATVVVLSRASQQWTDIQTAHDSRSEQAEALEEGDLREMTRNMCNALIAGMGIVDGVPKGAPKRAPTSAPKVEKKEMPKKGKKKRVKKKKQGGSGDEVKSMAAEPTVAEEPTLSHLIASDESLLGPVLAFCTSAICWPDTHTTQKACRIAADLIELVGGQPRYHSAAVALLSATIRALAGQNPEAADHLMAELVALARDVYVCLSRSTDAGRAVLATIPGVEHIQIKNLDEALGLEASSEKNQKRILRTFMMKHVVGLSVGQLRQSNAIKALDDRFAAQQTKLKEVAFTLDAGSLSRLFGDA